MYLWLHMQSAINIDVTAWTYGYYIVDILNIFKDGLNSFLMLLVCWSGVYWTNLPEDDIEISKNIGVYII